MMQTLESKRQSATEREKRFDWPLCYEAEALMLEQLNRFLQRNSFSTRLSKRMLHETGTLFLDWVDHIVVASRIADQFRAVGYKPDELAEADPLTLHHPEAMLPRVVIDRKATSDFPEVAAIRVESISDFIVEHALVSEPEGGPFGRFRRVQAAREGGTLLYAVERRGYRGHLPERPSPNRLLEMIQAHELWKTRRRTYPKDEEAFTQTHALLDRVIGLVGRDLACHVVFAEERAYWQRRNRAARIQKERQDNLGLGWANHDHHTFRSSRRHFLDLMRFLEKLGFERRERYYAGAQAGWGAQILEQSFEGIVAFCDVDLEPEETQIDFSREPLTESKRLGTIGLWVGLHGESLLQAGMHHLECRFDFDLLRDQLAGAQIGTMKPFSDFPFLKQAFTEGERWAVLPERVQRLLDSGLIDHAQADKFLREGAIGSHLENLQRKGGFKGFNQKSVSVIISATDPRKQVH